MKQTSIAKEDRGFPVHTGMKKFRKMVRDSYKGWLFATPLILGLLIFTMYPVLSSFVYSFFDYNGMTTFEFIGLKNYIRIFALDNRMPKIISNTLIYTVVSVPLNLVLSYFLALLVKQNDTSTKFYRVLYYSPVIIPSIVSGLLWRDMFVPNFGVFNQFMRLLTNNEDF